MCQSTPGLSLGAVGSLNCSEVLHSRFLAVVGVRRPLQRRLATLGIKAVGQCCSAAPLSTDLDFSIKPFIGSNETRALEAVEYQNDHGVSSTGASHE